MGGSFTEVDPGNVTNIPSLRSYTIDFDSSNTSSTYRFYMAADNIVGSVSTEEISFVLAAKPDKPTNPPYLNLAETRATQIQVNYDPLLAS